MRHLWVLLLAGACLGAAAAAPWRQVFTAADLRGALSGGGTVEEETFRNEAVMTAKLEGQAGRSIFGEAVLFAVTPGKYRATFRLSTVPYQRWTMQGLYVSAVQDGLANNAGQRAQAMLPPLPADGSPLAVTVAFTITDGNVEGGGKRLRLFVGWAGRGETPLIRHHGVTLERLTDSLALESVRVEKLLYRPGEPGVLRATIRNYAATEARGTLRSTLEHELADALPLPPVEVALAAGEVKTIEQPFTCPTIEYGYRVHAVVRSDGGEDSAEDFFNVADSLWKVCIGGQDMLSQSALTDKARIAQDLAQARNHYCNWLEKFFWAPDDWGDMTPEPGSIWLSGQTARYENFDNLKFAIDEAHRHGIKAITYGKAMAYGNVAFELARRHPDWFTLDEIGRPVGMSNDVAPLDFWRNYDVMADIANRSYHKGYNVARIYPDHRRLDTLDYAIDEVIGSAKLLGWDGIRFDSSGFRAYYIDGTKDGRDEVNTRAMKRLKERLWAWNPDFLIGHNTRVPAYLTKDGRMYPLSPDDPAGHEYRETLAGGCIYMNESIREQPMKNGAVAYTSWQRYANDEVQAVRTARGFGGHIFYSYGVGPFSASKLGRAHDVYKFVIGTMIGVHEYAGAHISVGGSEQWGKFLTRWSGFLWDHRLQPLGDGEKALAVDSVVPLWWQGFANSRVVNRDRRFVIVHLLNPPPSDEVAKTGDTLPPPVTDARVRFTVPRGETLVRAFVIAPGYPNLAGELPISKVRNAAGVTVPAFDVWAMVVWELTGKYVVPASPPRFSEPMNDAELKELRAWEERTVRINVADNLLNPTPQHNPALAPRHFGAPSVTMPDDFAPGGEAGPDVLIVGGLHHHVYGIPAAVKAVAPAARVTESAGGRVPKTYADAARFDVIVLVGIGADAWNADGLQVLADFARAGGRLVVLGGTAALGQGFYRGTPLEAVLPVEVRVARDIYRLPASLALGDAPEKPFAGAPRLYYYHAVQPRADATPRLWAGELPVLYEHAIGKGRALVFTGTVLGEPERGETPFWGWEGWTKVLGEIVLGR